MKKRLKNYLAWLEGLDLPTVEDKETLRRELLVQIGFFQHERLIHLIVTVLFAFLAVFAVLGCFLCPGPAAIALGVLIIALLIPYIMHYYLLENGVQRLYTYYDEVVRLQGLK